MSTSTQQQAKSTRGGIGAIRSVAQPLSVSGPSAGTAILPATVVAVTGTAGAPSFLLGLLAGGLVVYVLSSLARHFSSDGSLYFYAGIIGTTKLALLTGWIYLLTYLGFAGSVLSNEANFVNVALEYAKLPSISWPLVALVIWAICLYVVWRGAEFSTGFQVVVECLGIAALLLVGVTVLATGGDHGIHLGEAFSLSGVHGGKLFLGMAIALGSFGGFESGASLSEETHSARRTVPASMWISLLISGALYVFACVFITLGFPSLEALAASPAPLFALGERHFGTWAAFVMTSVVVIAGMSTVSAATTGAVRTLNAMWRDGLFGRRLTSTGVPPMVIGICGAAILGLSIGFARYPAYLAFEYVAAAAALLLTTSYLAVVMLSVYWFARLRSTIGVVIAVLASAVLGYSLWSSVYPAPEAPFSYLPYIDLALVAVGVCYLAFAGKAVRRVDSSTHWQAARTERDRLIEAARPRKMLR
ncbi:APC family permease [Kribbella solani]|uniref:APC family permease n=1 Tax=Kribbella solani TaxID=236067 RepID=UPI0029BADF9C|nr:APC family permease [Kribbella solani]MDX2972238.1 APC family permease [Kribbella solani]